MSYKYLKYVYLLSALLTVPIFCQDGLCASQNPTCCPGKNSTCSRYIQIQNKHCYCDQRCLEINDCCSDFSSSNCIVSCNVPNCQTCSSANYCSACANGYSRDTSTNPPTCKVTCNIQNCQSCSSVNYCSVCNSGYNHDTSTNPPSCKASCSVSNCRDCILSNICSSCAERYYLDNNVYPPVCKVYTGQLKATLNLPMKFLGSTLNLNLNINPDIPENLPITVSDNSGTYDKPNILPTGAYNDEKNKASFIVKFTRDSNKELAPKFMIGSIIRDNTFYTLIKSNESNADVEINNSKFKTVKEDLSNLTNNCFLTGFKPTLASLLYPSRRRRQSNQNIKNYEIELKIVVGKSFYNKFPFTCMNLSNVPKCFEDKQILVQSYVFLMINLANKRFESINKSNFTIKLKTADIQIIDGRYENLTESSKTDEGYMNADEALKLFGKFISNYSQPFDHALLLTGNPLYHSNKLLHDYTGFTYLGDMCKLSYNSELTRSISLVKGRGLFATVASLAHEIAHSMLANHDEDPINCPGSDQYIMASSISGLNPSNAGNIYYFSKCSIDAINSFLWSLDRQKEKNCLLMPNELKTYNFTNYTLDDQCSYIYGAKSKFCKGDHLDICYRLECTDPTTNVCVLSDEARAIDNTTCGQEGDFCMLGACHYTSSIGPESNMCLYGDYIGSFFVDGNINFTCSFLNARASMTEAEKENNPQRFRCYNTEVNRRCCQSCRYLTSPNATCKYGNSNPGYCRTIDPKGNYRCYDTNYRENCCSFCPEQYGSENCKYGDKASWCGSISFSSCLNDFTRSTCCKSCIFTTPPPTYSTRNTPPPTPFIKNTPIPTINNVCSDIWDTYCKTSLKLSDCTGEIKDIYCCISCNSLTPFTTPRYVTTSTYATTTPKYATTPTILIDTPTPLTTTASTLTTPIFIFVVTTPTPSPNCLNGDIWENWCKTTLDVSRCNEPTYATYCCSTCWQTTPTFAINTKSTPPNTLAPTELCPNGNIWVDWCGTYLTFSDCFVEKYLTNCCLTCYRKFGVVSTSTTATTSRNTPTTKCSQVDTWTVWCRINANFAQCQNSHIYQNCCQSCLRYLA